MNQTSLFKVTLPARMTVDQILNNYVKYKTASKSNSSQKANRECAVIEVSAGLKVSMIIQQYSNSCPAICVTDTD
jgi:hypothetical protein